jgi:hypothetical protein
LPSLWLIFFGFQTLSSSMRFLAQAIGPVAAAHCFLLCLWLGSIFTDASAIPLHERRLDDHSTKSVSAPRNGDLFPFLGQKVHPEFIRALPPVRPRPVKPTKPTDPLNPADPDAPTPLTPNNPDDVNPPPAVKPNTPVDSVPAPDPEIRLGQQTPKANAKPDPYGPVPTEAEIATLCSIPENKAIFWSDTADQVHQYKTKAGLVSDSQAYPEGYTWTFRTIKNPTMAQKNDEFAARFSRVFARTAKGEVRVMVRILVYEPHAKHALTWYRCHGRLVQSLTDTFIRLNGLS